MPKDFTAHEGPPIFKIEDALLLYNPAVNPDTCFTEKFQKDDTIHEELTVHLAINGKRPRTGDECKTVKVLKAPWGNLFHRWTIEKDGDRYFVKLINGRWRPWMGKIMGLSRKAIAFPVELQDFRARQPSTRIPSSPSDSDSSDLSATESRMGNTDPPVDDLYRSPSPSAPSSDSDTSGSRGPNSVVSISSDSADTTVDDAPEKSPPNSSIQLRPHPNHKDHIPANILDQQQIGRTVETQPTDSNEVASPHDDAFEDCSSNEDTDEPQSYTSNATPAITIIETPKKSVQTLKDEISSMHKSYMEEKLAIDKLAELLATAQESSGRLKRNCDAAQATADIYKVKLEPGLSMVPGMRREWQDAQSAADRLRSRLNVVRAELKRAVSYIASQRAEQAIERASLSHYTPTHSAVN
ncbi:MAG: hypothetical protein Q9176_005880 [Flavoplaca citrina]